ncbi:MAG: cob(I)yrinic acid a,c-diamide adenosyltransferase [bacterium]|nr:cob(I)yrinic acid a,c-diamide adenosyltransferase [bacterium]
MSIYTKKGDTGRTCLIASLQPIDKDSQKICLLGALDESNSFIGLANCFCTSSKTKKDLVRVQENFFSISALLAGSSGSFDEKEVLWLEKRINVMETHLPPLKSFLLPGGSIFATYLQVARAVTRRAERELVRLGKNEPIPPVFFSYLNRLSDYLFVLGRLENIYPFNSSLQLFVNGMCPKIICKDANRSMSGIKHEIVWKTKNVV